MGKHQEVFYTRRRSTWEPSPSSKYCIVHSEHLSNIIYMSAAAELSSVQGSHIWCLETKLTTKQAKYFVENR